jgi:FtsP/CotA-like multicopper oxidase with cupredoxin domain
VATPIGSNGVRLKEGPLSRGVLRLVTLVLAVALPLAVATASVARNTPAAHDHAAAGAAGPQHRTYFIAADTVAWNFAPSGRNGITGEAFDEAAAVFVQSGRDRIGSTYFLSQYRQYTDATFHELVARTADDAYLGILGPTIHAAVGDDIDVVFRNNTPYPASVHAHGVFYGKASEGAPYADGTTGGDRADDAVATGATVTYHWTVPERAGPGPMDPSSIVWMYHSHTDEVRDTNSGLLGAIVVSRADVARPDGTPSDVDREIVADFQIFDQNQSWYLDQDIARFAKVPSSVHPDDEDFGESNLMHSINGYVYGNMPRIQLRVGERVRWYLMDLGTEVDLHTPHWHGNSVLMNGMNRADMIQLLPGGMTQVDMTPDNPGTWLFHCHVNDHILAGMQTLYEVLPAKS